MFKLFRQYNKYILAIGVSLLMVVFLIEGAITGRQSQPGSEVIGAIAGREVRGTDVQRASGQIAVIAAIDGSGGLRALMSSRIGETPDPLAWMLMVEESRLMGISASEFEVDTLLKSLGLDDDNKLMQRVKNLGAPMPTVRDAIRDWIAVQHYRELVLGRAHTPVESKLQGIQFISILMQMGRYSDLGAAIEMARGLPRVSEPLLARYLQDESARVRISAVKIEADSYASKVASVDEKLVTQLYEQYKGSLPRVGPAPEKPDSAAKSELDAFGFGYRVPDLAKLEYLTIPLSRVSDMVQLDEADLLSYYEQHKSEFVPPTPESKDPAATKPAPQPPQPYEAVRDQIEKQLRNQRAWELGEKIVAAAVAQMTAPLKEFREESGYRILPADFKGPALSAVAESIQKQFGVLPDVQRVEDRWLDRDAVEMLPGFGRSMLPSQRTITTDYVFSAKEFAPKAEVKSDAKTSESKTPIEVARKLRLQVGVPSVPVVDMTGTRYLFRVTAVQPSREPKNLDEVRAKVTADAKRLQAYRLLKADAASLVKRMVTDGPNALAKELGIELMSPPEFPRRQNNPQTGELTVPYVMGIGADATFVDGVFALVDQAGGPALANLPAEKRTGAVPVDNQFSVMIVQLDEYKPLTKSQFAAQSRGGFVASRATAQIMSGSEKIEPFSLESLSKRLKYVPRGSKEDAKEEADSGKGEKTSTQKG